MYESDPLDKLDQEKAIPDDPIQAAEVLEASARALKRRIEESQPSLADPVSKQVENARNAGRLEVDVQIAQILRRNTTEE